MSITRLVARSHLLPLAGVLLIACHPQSSQMTPSPNAQVSSVRGTVAYRDRSALPPDAEIEVWIMDTSPGIMIQSILSQTTVKTNGRQVPIPFELTFDPGRVVPSHPYAVKAVIKSGGQMLYETTSEAQRVITLSNSGAVILMLSRVQAEPQPSPSLEGTSWRLEDLGGAGVIDNIEATLEFLAGGKVAGKGSCNRFFGTATISGPSLTIGGIGSTRMACPPALMDQESKYLAALGKSQRFQMQGTTLLINFGGGEKPLRFVRAGQ